MLLHVPIGQTQQQTHRSGWHDFGERSKVAPSVFEPLCDGFPGPSPDDVLELADARIGESWTDESAMNRVIRFVRGGDDLGSVGGGQVERYGLALLVSDQYACEVGRKVVRSVEDFDDALPCGDHVDAGFGHARHGVLFAYPSIEGMRVFDGLCIKNFFGV
jgi:hypothetical protein